MVKCVCWVSKPKGSTTRPYPGELGQRIYDNVSKEAWQRWLKHQTMLLNEYRLRAHRAPGPQISGRGNAEVLLRRRLGQAQRIQAIRRRAIEP